MNWLDLGLILFLIIFVIIGLKRGFMTSMLSSFSLGLNSAISFFMAKPISMLYNKWFHLGETISKSYSLKLVESSPDFGFNLMTLNQVELPAFINNTLSNSNIAKLPRLLFRWFINKSTLYTELHESSHTSRTLSDIISSSYSTFFVSIISFFTSLILIYIIVLLFKLLVKKLRENGFVKAVDNTLGAVYGVLRMFLVLVGVCVLIKLLSPFSFMTVVVDYINASLFGKVIYSQINNLLDNYLNYSDLIRLIFKT